MRNLEQMRRHANQLLALAINALEQGQTEIAEQLIAKAIKDLDEIGAPRQNADEKH